jgi:large subunit ribosomal protein L32
MAVPRQHLAKGRQKRRRSHLALKALKLSACSHCKKKIVPHTVCKSCGYYGGKEVVNVLAKELKKQEKKKRQQGQQK